MYCKKCGYPYIDDDALFCPNCGQKCFTDSEEAKQNTDVTEKNPIDKSKQDRECS